MTSDIVNVHQLRAGEAEAMEIIVHGDSKTSKLVGKSISDLNLPDSIIIGAIVRGEEVLLANDELVVETNDHVIIFVLQKKDISKIEKMFQVSVGFF